MATDTMTQQTVDVVTPAAGESVTEGTILEWHVKVGDEIKVDETIVEISTDKVDVELPSPATGVVSEILVEEGDTVTVGQGIARIALGGGAPPQAPTPADPPVQASNGHSEAPSADQESATNGQPSAPADGKSVAATADGKSLPAPSDGGSASASSDTEASSGQVIDVLTPAAGESVSEGTILEWHVKVGGQVKVDETIVEISTDKVDLELPSPASGTVTEILVEEGDTVTVGQVIARIAVGAGAAAAPADGPPASTSAAASAAP